MTPNGLKLDAYIRVSKVAGRAGESFQSPEQQHQQIESWAQAHGHTLTWNAPELDVSGGTMSRPIFDQIMQRIRAGQSDGLIVAKLDRFARTLVGALSTLEEFESHNAVLVSVADNIDLSTPMGKAFLRILLVFAELERDRIKESWEAAGANAIARGIHIAKFPLAGYDKGSDKRLVPNALAPAVREAFLMRGAHRSHTAIARKLNEIAPRPNGGLWTPQRVQRMLTNRAYTGAAYRGDQFNPNAHQPIVTVAEWQAAQLAPVRSEARGKLPNLLGGLVRCAACRYLLAPKVAGSKMGGDWPTYRCSTLHTAGRCPEPASVNRRKLDDFVEAAWRRQLDRARASLQRDSTTLQAATDALSLAQEELAAFAADLTARRTLGEGYHAALEVRSKAVNDAQATVQNALGAATNIRAEENYYELSVEDRKLVLASSIDAVIVKRGHARVPIEDRVTILWCGEGPDDLPRRGRDNGPIRPYVI
jgi:DNA invertase Pin-like site-specific DNA recombinase